MKPTTGTSGSQSFHGESSRKKPETSEAEPSKQSAEARMKAQIARNNEWIQKMSPVIKYRIQEYMRKQTSKKQQRRKFSIARGLPNKGRTSETGGKRSAKSRRVHSEIEMNHAPRDIGRSTRQNEQQQRQQQPQHVHISRRQSAPPVDPSRNPNLNQNFDLRSLEDLE